MAPDQAQNPLAPSQDPAQDLAVIQEEDIDQEAFLNQEGICLLIKN